MKDPAFLFYFRDFKSSTENMSNAARGAYIQLMCIQAENGYVTEKDMIKICSNICFDTMQIITDFEALNQIKSRFTEKKDRPGEFVNVRLDEEIKKRVKYSESRRNNRNKNEKQSYDNTYDNTHDLSYEKHMVNGNVNGNINENRIEEKGVQGEKQKFGTATPKSSDPAEVNFSPEQDPELLAQIAKNTQCPKDQIDHRFSQYRLSCIADNVVRDKKGHIAGFTKWMITWHTFESKHAHNQNEQVKNEKLNDTKHKLRQMANSYL